MQPDQPTAPDVPPPLEASGLFEGIDHVGYAVADLDEAIRLHTEVLGWRLEHREVNPEQGVAEAMLVAGDGHPDRPRVQLLAPLTEDSPVGRFLARSGPGVQQVAYRVRDIEQVSRVLRARGLTLVHDRAVRGTGGSLVNFVHPRSTGGVLLEIVQPAEPPAGTRPS
ncbi:methylmalonyl-CoA epimerase [Desertihabitans aurantiacus]|uniref:methylmalonyl-CoA epimerase n=1 Tax=Desertihabitans aurantiacus TaxID=2282477 RepID=UPI001E575737|nr:methylmalonyl-CoA epimerase [Desertihabitans aurantiacus]